MLYGRIQRNNLELLEEKVTHRLSSWKHKLLNEAGRLTLVRYVLNFIPNYYMQVTCIPQPTCDFIDMMARNFLGKDNSNYDVHLIGWNKITKPKKLDGLGIQKEREANTSMLCKLVWDLHRDCDSPWV